MAIVELIQTYNVQTKEGGMAFMISFEESPTFADKEVADQVAAEINEVLEHSNG